MAAPTSTGGGARPAARLASCEDGAAETPTSRIIPRRPQSVSLLISPSGARRVENGRGGLGHLASPRFPSPLIERSMRISRTTLSDWLHRNAHDVAHDRSRL